MSNQIDLLKNTDFSNYMIMFVKKPYQRRWDTHKVFHKLISVKEVDDHIIQEAFNMGFSKVMIVNLTSAKDEIHDVYTKGKRK